MSRFALASTMLALLCFPSTHSFALEQCPYHGASCTCGCCEGGECSCGPKDSACNQWDYQDNSCCNRWDGVIDQADTSELTHVVDESDILIAKSWGLHGIWLPEDPVLFRQFMADPRQITYSVGWRFNDQALTKNVIDVSYGDSLAIYRWFDVWPLCGELQIELEGALWACFDPCHESAPLLNADYYVGIPITYAIDQWSFRLRAFHISSHLGDEFLLNHPGFDRRNPSAEYLDFFFSYDWTDEIRLYGGFGGIVQQDHTFATPSRLYSECGFELRLDSLGFTDYRQSLYGTPFFAADFRFRGEHRRHLDSTYVLGYEFGKMSGLCRKVRLFMEYHDGYSVEGQFSKIATNYFSLRMTYGF